MSKGLQTFTFSFNEPHLTHFGGMMLIQRFCKLIKSNIRLTQIEHYEFLGFLENSTPKFCFVGIKIMKKY